MTDTQQQQSDNIAPPGDYAIVEILGHRTMIGRVSEVERFGTKLLSIEPLFDGELLPAVLVGGGSLYQFTPCTAEVAVARMPRKKWQLPASISATLSGDALAIADASGEPDSDDNYGDLDEVF